GARRKHPDGRLFAVLEPRSNTMKMGVHRDTLGGSLREADRILLSQPEGVEWSLQDVAVELGDRAAVTSGIDALVTLLASEAVAGDTIVLMSNGGFGGIHDKLLSALEAKS
ncbi:MAG: UDP-N-acetylmuramate:L-alanyl-gamma-D-glutamyl-meso-diaminopimelate ligase, partial [Gammaproteobacteria bacterium]|nr:UDP-N-acetylmuramate:L-alanyl-gamma-D-glutamyl-meso-diaminopimelate ligase [Gammaproteobacteria bacterium]